MSRAEQAGRTAFANGVPRHNGRFQPSPQERSEWWLGWDTAERQHREDMQTEKPK